MVSTHAQLVPRQSLNLRLNRLGDEGGKMLLDGMLENSSLTQLNLSCNALEFDSAQTVAP